MGVKTNRHRRNCAWSMCLITLLLGGDVQAGGTKNLLSNGGFEKGLEDDGQPVGWLTKITGIIPAPEYRDPQNKKGRTGKYQYECGCGHVWGEVRPWAMLNCPKCKRVNAGLEDSGDLYQGNDQYVKIAKREKGKALRMTLPEAIGNNQGVRVISHMLKAKRGAGYEVSFDAISQGSHLRVFVEGFRLERKDEEAKKWLETLPPQANPLKQKMRLKRVFRKQVNAGKPEDWRRYREPFVAPKRYEFDYMFVSLYAYLPGKAAYDNVKLRRLSAAELREYRKANPGPKDKRLR